MRKDELDINNADDAKKIAKGCAKNDRYYQHILYSQTFKQMMGICLRYSSNSEEAMDFVQDGYVKVFERIDSYQMSGSLVLWIKRIIVNNLVDSLRKTSKFHFSDIDEEKIDESYDADEELDRIARKERSADRIVELLQELSPVYRAVFNMYVVDELPHNEIAERLGISVGTSKSNLAKAKQRLRQMYINKYGEDE